METSLDEIIWENALEPGSTTSHYVDTVFDFIEHEGKFEYHRITGTDSLFRAAKSYSPISSLIMKMAAMYSNGLLEVVNATTKNYTRGQYKNWDKVFANPNPFQTGDEFLTQLNAFTMLRGYCYVQPVYSAAFKDIPIEMWIIPPWCIEVRPLNKPPFKGRKASNVREVWFVYGSYREKLDESKLILFKDSGSPFINKKTWLPESRLTNLEYPISNGIGAMESRHTLIHERGANGIISNEASDNMGDIGMDEDEKQKLQDYYKGRYGLTKSKRSSVIISNAAVKFQSMTTDVKSLMLHEEHIACSKDICDAYGFPFLLFSNGEDSTFNNQDAIKKSAYQDCIIPMANKFTAQFIAGLRMLEYNVKLLFTFDHLPVFQINQLEKGRGLTAQMTGLKLMWDLGIITRNGMLLQLGLDTIEDERKVIFDKFKYELTPEEMGVVVPEAKPGKPNNNA